MEKIFIKNRKGMKVCVVVDENPNSVGLVFLMHGLGGYKEQPQLQVIAEIFYKKGFTAVLFDTTNTFGESDGNYEESTTTNYYEDLEDVVSWAKKQKWYKEPFVLEGHSLGGLCILLYAEKNPNEILALAPVSPVVSGPLSLEMKEKYDKKDLEQWRSSGWRITPSESKPGVIKKLPWSHMEDRLKYNAIPGASKLTMPVLMVVGEKDDTTPLESIMVLEKVLPGQKEIQIIKNAGHTMRDLVYLNDLKNVFNIWIDKIVK